MYCEPTELKDNSDAAAPSGKKDGALDLVETHSGADDAAGIHLMVGQEEPVGSRLIVGEDETGGQFAEVLVATDPQPVRPADSVLAPQSVLPAESVLAPQSVLPAQEKRAVSSAASVVTATASPEHSYWFKLAMHLAIAMVGLGAIVSYCSLHFSTGLYYWILTGNQATEYMHNSSQASYVGVLVALFCCGEFLGGFAGMKHSRFSVAVKVLIALIICLGGAQNGGPVGAMVGLLCAACSVAMGFLAHFMRQAIPSTFRFSRAVFYTALAALPAAAMSLCGIYSAVTNPLSLCHLPNSIHLRISFELAGGQLPL